jgi:hypothetical protein
MWAADLATSTTIRFDKEVRPILEARCWQCHGAQKRKAGLDLRTPMDILRGGDTGPALTPGTASTSLLWEKIAKNEMPPGKTKLTDKEKSAIRAWIETGTLTEGLAGKPPPDAVDRPVTDQDRRFWSFQPPRRPATPEVRHKDRVRNPIDGFILAALEKKDLSLAPEADRLTLLRRATFDLTGLPPTPPEVEAFLADNTPNAYERLIDRLLASEHYGERWARHWLDQAGYADSEGILDADYERSAAWRYRDYVIRAVNSDKPYDRFLKEQLAGDELCDYWKSYHNDKHLKPEIVEALVATGYLRCASDASRRDFSNIKNATGYYFQTLDDTVKIVASSLVGLTVQCARCHNHKFDPIPQVEYYRMQAIFQSAYRPEQWVAQSDRHLYEATAQEEKQSSAARSATLGGLERQLADLRKEFSSYLFTGRLAKLPEPIRNDVRTALQTEPAKRTEVQKYLASKFEKELRPDLATLDRVLPTMFLTYKKRAKELDDSLKAARNKKNPYPEIRALYDLPGEATTHLLRRGDYLSPGKEVKPGVLTALVVSQAFAWTPPAKHAHTSGRRLAFATWLTQPEHPLTARVQVNRLWLHHFGEGIVSTPDDFGHTGSPPSHPELLDWLATEFVARGWSQKAMHRLIMTSSTYRQVSTFDLGHQARAREVDPENRLLWRQRIRRLEAESLRDTILACVGDLNPQMFGMPVPMERKPDGEVVTPDDASGRRRSIYLQVRRSQPLTFLQVFDQPIMETNCTRRGNSTVASQALLLMNSDFLTAKARTLAKRAMEENPADPAEHALLLAYGRHPTNKEKEMLGAFIETQAARDRSPGEHEKAPSTEARTKALCDLCHMLLTSNEFSYVD